jgi:hypothetical protein
MVDYQAHATQVLAEAAEVGMAEDGGTWDTLLLQQQQQQRWEQGAALSAQADQLIAQERVQGQGGWRPQAASFSQVPLYGSSQSAVWQQQQQQQASGSTGSDSSAASSAGAGSWAADLGAQGGHHPAVPGPAATAAAEGPSQHGAGLYTGGGYARGAQDRAHLLQRPLQAPSLRPPQLKWEGWLSEPCEDDVAPGMLHYSRGSQMQR